MYGVYTVFLAGKSPDIRSYTVPVRCLIIGKNRGRPCQAKHSFYQAGLNTLLLRALNSYGHPCHISVCLCVCVTDSKGKLTP
jgi:hypothetical protein